MLLLGKNVDIGLRTHRLCGKRSPGMSNDLVSAPTWRAWNIPGWAPAILVLIAAAPIGPGLGGSFRPVFVLGCGAAGWYAWRSSPSAHLQALLFLFTFTPLVRRLVDLSAGYDQTGIMLVGPLVAMLAPVPRLRCLLEGGRPMGPQMGPIMMVGG